MCNVEKNGIALAPIIHLLAEIGIGRQVVLVLAQGVHPCDGLVYLGDS